MDRLSFILADADLAKLALFVVVAIFWGIGALAQTIKKATEEGKRRAAARPLPRTQSAVPARRVATPAPRQTANMARPAGAGGYPAANVQRAQAAKRTSPAPLPPPRPQATRPPSQMGRQPSAVAAPIRQPSAVPTVQGPARLQAPARPQATARVQKPAVPTRAVQPPIQRPPGALNAADVRLWLQPDKLRQQFVLSEIFQPPVSLRDPG